MDEYRQSLLGRALADVLQKLEGDGSLDAAAGDAIFSLFDTATREELREAPGATHDELALRARADTYNRFMDKWSVAVTLPPGSDGKTRGKKSSCGLLLDGAVWPVPPPARAPTRMLVKLHAPPPPSSTKRKNKRAAK